MCTMPAMTMPVVVRPMPIWRGEEGKGVNASNRETAHSSRTRGSPPHQGNPTPPKRQKGRPHLAVEDDRVLQPKVQDGGDEAVVIRKLWQSELWGEG